MTRFMTSVAAMTIAATTSAFAAGGGHDAMIYTMPVAKPTQRPAAMIPATVGTITYDPVQVSPLTPSTTVAAPVIYETVTAPAPVLYAPAPAPVSYTPAAPVTYSPTVLTLKASDTTIHRIVTQPDISTTINFKGAERVNAVVAGDTQNFALHTLKSRQTVTIEPDRAGLRTNLSVTTTKAVYHFDVVSISAHGAQEQPHYGVVISNEDEADKDRIGFEPHDLNLAYTYRGDDGLRPLSTFDDGTHTYFSFPDHIDAPAIFAVNDAQEESVVNYHVRGNYIVVNSIERQFTLRDGNAVTCIYNKKYPTANYGLEAPRKEGGA